MPAPLQGHQQCCRVGCQRYLVAACHLHTLAAVAASQGSCRLWTSAWTALMSRHQQPTASRTQQQAPPLTPPLQALLQLMLHCQMQCVLPVSRLGHAVYAPEMHSPAMT